MTTAMITRTKPRTVDPRGRLDLLLIRMAEECVRHYVEPRLGFLRALDIPVDLAGEAMRAEARKLVERHVIRRYKVPRRSILPPARGVTCT